ncbi:MAG: GTP cyclohydrolase I FolE [Nitrospirales bacterium]|nr:GTP cyclohydrolase I FolE [Nitrospirales bacterium]
MPTKPKRPSSIKPRALGQDTSEAVQTPNLANLEIIVKQLLENLGENPRRHGLTDTPKRVARSLTFLTKGYQQDIDELLNGALFPIEYDEMVIVRDIDFFSLCEHHLLPFFGKCHIGYIPNKHVVGLSKIPRVVDAFSRRLQVQERLTVQIAHTLHAKLKPRGVAVVMEARHLCMSMRGVEKQNTVAVTSEMLGVFRKQQQTRDEFLKLIRQRGCDGD